MRVSTLSTFGRVLLGLRANQLASLRAQEQLSSGRRILRPSDDPAGTARALVVRRELSRTERIQSAIATGGDQLQMATSTLENASELMTRARELVVQSMNGTLSDPDREAIAVELGEIREQLMEAANMQVDGNYLFGGTRSDVQPWEELQLGGLRRVVYRGNRDEQTIQVGLDTQIAISAAGDEVFGRAVPGPTRFDGLTGVRGGVTADEGSGYAYLIVRHDTTEAGTLSSVGVGLVDDGEGDTLLGANALSIDAAAGTIQLAGGPVVTIPPAGQRSDVVVENELGGELHLDLTGWNGADFDGTVTGHGSVSIDGDTFTSLAFTEGDLELSDGALGFVLHVDTTQIRRAGSELVTFGDTVNPFDLLQGVVEDLRNDGGLDSAELNDRLSVRLDDLERVHDDVLRGLGALGSRAASLVDAAARQEDVELELHSRLSKVEDADLAEAALDLARSDMVLQVAQAAGARVIQTTLLDFLG